MISVDQKAEFARAIEDEFLPSMIKPGRYASLEWVAPAKSESLSDNASAGDADLPLAVIVGLKSYERSVNEPQIVATRLALLDSGDFRVGSTYPFGPEALAALESLKLAPFSGPDFTPLVQADILLAPLNDWTELSALAKVLQAARIPFSKAQRSQAESETSFPRLVALVDSEIPAIANEIFDSVLPIADFLASPTVSLKKQSASDTSNSPVSLSPLIPSRPIVPQIEVAQQKARFSVTSFSESNDISSELVKSVKLSGLTEIGIENCANAVGKFDLAEAIDKLAHQIEARRYSILLRDVAPGQVTQLLAGALSRFRRVRVELFTPSLSPSALAERQMRFDREQFVNCLSLLQIEPLQSLHLRIELGHAIDESIEARESCETLRECSRVLNPRRGLRVKFERYISRFAPVREEAKIRELFENIKRGGRIKGVTYVLEESASKLFSALIQRNAFHSVDQLQSFIDSSQDDGPSAYWNEYAEVFASKLESQNTGVTSFEICSTDSAGDSSSLAAPNGATSNVVTCNVVTSNGADNRSVFGRRKKRTVITTVSAPTKTRLRFSWAVTGPARFLSHLDNLRAIESALLRSGFPLTYTQGQRPRLKISFGAPKPVGFTSDCEMFDAHFETMPSSGDIQKLAALLPPGYRIVSAEKAMTKELSILESICNATYLIGVTETNTGEKLASALAQNRLLYTRRNKKREREVDLRPGVFEAKMLDKGDCHYDKFFANCASSYSKDGSLQVLKLTLALTDTFYVRPEEFLDAAGILNRQDSTKAKIHRLQFGFENLRPLATECMQESNLAS